MSNLILRDWNGKSIRHREDGFMSLTDMCQAGGKLFAHWHTLKSTQEYLEAISEKYYRDHDNTPIETSAGNLGEKGGTWGDRRVALRLAQWISPHFALQVDEWVEELLTTGNVNIGPDPIPEPEQKALPGTSLEKWGELIRDLGLRTSPIVMSAFEQRLSEELSGKSANNIDAPILVAVRANQLGCSHKSIGDGSKLGTYIRTMGFKSLGKSQHGKYRVNTYHPSTELDNAIIDYCNGADQ